MVMDGGTGSGSGSDGGCCYFVICLQRVAPE